MSLKSSILLILLAFSTGFNSYSGWVQKATGIHLSKRIKLKHISFHSYAIYETGSYIIYVDKAEIMNDLKRALPNYNFDTLTVTGDTLNLNLLQKQYRLYIEDHIAKHIDNKEAIILNTASGEQIYHIKRRKYNRKTVRTRRRGGIEYLDAKNNGLILDLGLWIS